MRLPGFNAESALGPARHHYRGRFSYGAGGAPLAPQQSLDDGDIELEEDDDDVDIEVAESGEMIEE